MKHRWLVMWMVATSMTISVWMAAQQKENEPRTPRVNLVGKKQVKKEPKTVLTTSSAAQGAQEPNTVHVAPAGGNTIVNQSLKEPKTPGVGNTKVMQGQKEPGTPNVQDEGTTASGEDKETHPAPKDPRPAGDKEGKNTTAGGAEPEPPLPPPPIDDSCSCRAVGKARSGAVTRLLALVWSMGTR